MNVYPAYSYRSAEAIISSEAPSLIGDIVSTLSSNNLTLSRGEGQKQRDLSKQIAVWFTDPWQKEHPCGAISSMKYDLWRDNIPVEIEIGHQRLVFPDFFKFLADYSKGNIAAAIMIVTKTPTAFGADWHCSLQSTMLKLEAVKEVYLVPTLVLPIDP